MRKPSPNRPPRLTPHKDPRPAADLRVLIADDHSIVRKGLKQLLTDEFSGVVFGEAGNAHELLEQAGKQTWDIVLLDITMPGQSGLDVLKQLKEIQPSAGVLILSMHPEEQYAVRMLKAGAAGYITKNTAAESVPGAIRKVLAGGTYISNALAEELAQELKTPREQKPHERLSDREFQVLQLIGAGKSVKDIGFELSLSVKTVSTYRVRLLGKLKVNSTAELIRYALEAGLV